jgi:outer membrane cobalamin receptor
MTPGRILTIAILCLVPVTSYGLEGIVLDAEQGSPLSGVTIWTTDGRAFLTGAEGTFRIVARDSFLVTFSRIGYTDQTLHVTPNASVTVRLVPAPIQMDRLDVTDQRDIEQERARLPTFSTVIQRKDFENRTTTLPDLLDRSTGIQVQSLGGLDAFSTISVRGSSSEQVEVYLDDILLNAAIGGGVNLSTLPLSNVDRIEINRGAGQEGNGLGGTVHIHTRDGDSTRQVINGSWGALDTRLLSTMISGSSDHLDYLAILDYASSDNDFGFLDNNGTEYNATDDEYTNRQNNDATRRSVFGNVSADLTGRIRISASQTFFWKHQGIPGISNNQATHSRFNAFRSLSQVSVERRSILKRITAEGTAYFTHLRETFIDSLGEVGIGRQDNRYRTRTFGIRSHSRLALSAHLLSLLTDIRRERYDPEARIQLVTPLFASRRWTLQLRPMTDFSFLDGRISWTSSLDYRHQRDRFSGRNPFAFSPQAPDSLTRRDLLGLRTGIRVDLMGPLMLKANLARSRRGPSFFELFGDRGSVVGNTNLAPETARTWDAGLRLQAGPTSLEVAYFDQRYDDLIQFAQTSQATSRPENIGKARVWGLEVSGAASPTTWISLSGNYTHQDSEDQSDIPHLLGNTLPGRPRHMLNTQVGIYIRQLDVAYDYAFEAGNFLDQANRRELRSRHIHTITIGYHVRESDLLGLGVRNLTDARVNDTWGYPLPGRSWFVSLTKNW